MEGYSKTRAFRDSGNHIFQSQWFRKYLSYEADIFFQNAEIFVQIGKMQ